jgi:hypothetical protein
MLKRWAEAHDVGRVLLDSFTQAQLDCVTLDPEYLPAEARGPALQTVTPLLAELEAQQAGRDNDPLAGSFAATTDRTGPAGMAELLGGDHALADAAARLEQLGYIRPGSPAPASEPVPAELAGWSANPAGQPSGVRRVAITGDLGIITRLRSQPYWVTEVSACPEPTRPELMAEPWPVVGRMYAAYRPLGALAELPAGPDGAYPPFALLWDKAVLPMLISWCGVNIEAPDDQLEAVHGALTAPLSAELSGRFTGLAQMRVVRSHGQEVRLSLLVVASAGERQWLLEGEGGERVTEVRKIDLANRLVGLLKDQPDQPGSAGQPGAASQPGAAGEDAGASGPEER